MEDLCARPATPTAGRTAAHLGGPLAGVSAGLRAVPPRGPEPPGLTKFGAALGATCAHFSARKNMLRPDCLRGGARRPQVASPFGVARAAARTVRPDPLRAHRTLAPSHDLSLPESLAQLRPTMAIFHKSSSTCRWQCVVVKCSPHKFCVAGSRLLKSSPGKIGVAAPRRGDALHMRGASPDQLLQTGPTSEPGPHPGPVRPAWRPNSAGP